MRHTGIMCRAAEVTSFKVQTRRWTSQGHHLHARGGEMGGSNSVEAPEMERGSSSSGMGFFFFCLNYQDST